MTPFLLLPALVMAAPGADEGTFTLTKARIQAVNAGDVDGLMNYYESNAEALLPDGRRIKGSQALRDAWKETFAKGMPKVEVKEVTYLASPDGVFAYGTVVVNREGQATETYTWSEYRVKRQGRWMVRFEGRTPFKG
jgi:ketosteroid isomerase-like protein